MPESPVLDAEVAAFRKDGAVCLRNVFGPEWLERLRAGTEQALAEPGPYHHVQSGAEDPGYFFTEYYLAHRLPAFRSFVRESPAAWIAARLMASAAVKFFFDGLFVKEPGTRKPSAWHQDQPYYPIDGRQVIILWLPLDPVSRETCLHVVRGSHRWDRWFVPVLFRGDRTLAIDEPRYEPVPDVDTNPEAFELASWDMAPGDCIAFHGLSLHGARGNETRRRRRALSTTWLGDDAVFAPRPGELEPHFERLRYPLGNSLTDETEFPRVWPSG